MNTATADLCDTNDAAQVCLLAFRSYGGRHAMQGPVRTVRCSSHAGLVRDQVKLAGDGAVLVIDAGGRLDLAFLGERLAEMAMNNGWGGVLVHGAVRDTVQLAAMDFCVMALGAVPRRASLDRVGEVGIALQFGGAFFTPGGFVVADLDGVVVLPGGGT